MVWRFLGIGRCSLFENMAIDEAVFQETIDNGGRPALRFYWSASAAVSIGYFQNAKTEISLESCRVDQVDVARRITGGKAVLHCREITYSLTAPSTESLFPGDILGTYRIVSRCIARGLDYLGIRTQLARRGATRTETAGACCFSVASEYELLAGGRKICGSAQVRRRGGFLQHGLLFIDLDSAGMARYLSPGRGSEADIEGVVTSVNRERNRPAGAEEICSCLKKGFEEELGVRFEDDGLSAAEEALRNRLMGKYLDEDWNIERRKYF